jgi:fucose permease
MSMAGIFLMIMGTALPAMRVTLQMDMAQAGLLGSFFWFGLTAAMFAGGALCDILNRQRVVMLACLMMGLSGVLIGVWNYFLINCFLFGALGAGIGIYSSSSSALIMGLYTGKEGGVINVLHAFQSIGAIAGPMAMVYVLRQGWHWRWMYHMAGIFTLALAVVFASFKVEQGKNESSFNYRSFFQLLKEKNLILLVLITILGLGVQAGLFFWLVSFLKEVRSFPIFSAALGLSLFSLGMATGRLLSGWLTTRLGGTNVLLILLSTLNLALLLLVKVSYGRWPLAISFMAGLGCSGIYPVVLSLGKMNFPQLSGTTIGIIGTACGVGSMILPWLMSLVSQPTSLTVGFFVSNIAAFIALCIILSYLKTLRNSEKAYRAALSS